LPQRKTCRALTSLSSCGRKNEAEEAQTEQ
jgi:hypothetical protein